MAMPKVFTAHRSIFPRLKKGVASAPLRIWWNTRVLLLSSSDERLPPLARLADTAG